jgi:alkylated DNA repair dioxygenase AlkB
VRLDSGDVFIFGGRSRMIVHSVLRVIPHTMPGYMRKHMREGRLNITFRYVPGNRQPC